MSPTSSLNTLLPLVLTFALTTASASASASALATVQFTSYGTPNCASAAIGSARVVSTYCVNIEDFPISSFSASVSEPCEAGQTAVLRLFGEAGCDEGVLEEVELGTGGEDGCFGFEGTVRSLSVHCV
ncbi:uncharacterized protein LDX57_000850 [Aspergillus melleus]|uniref:uncharacterized protein n=1 Tax=Aspergillus melleus TaxID=138277 RepID=UPI001E8D2B50|nr:uncharacterized protein LDX57_000850 [Aspergillus melleus]KAH8423094.1 hypothetical protein LDX57_000850 [Aspergillus melleus]